MSRLSALSLAALVALAACGRLRPLSAGETSSAGATSGSAGPVGVTGVAGRTGNTGSASMADVAGTSGTAGAVDARANDADASGDRALDAGAADGASGPFTYAAVAGCSKDGWCWSTPTPQGSSLVSISGSSANDVWAVGDEGAIIHWDGNSWTEVPSGLQTIWVPTGGQSALRGVWSAGPGDAWAVGDAILHWDGTSWSVAVAPVPNVFWQAVWGAGPSDVWIVGYAQPGTAGATGRAAMHWDGNQWTTTHVETGPEPPSFTSLVAVWGTGHGDVWTLDDQRGLFHWDGQSWTTVSTGQLPGIGRAIWGTSSSDLWIGAVANAWPSHWNGQDADVHVDASGEIYGLWGSGADDVWAVGNSSAAGDLVQDPYEDGGVILHWNGQAWDPMPSTGAGNLYGVWGSRSEDVWAVGEGGDIVHWDGRAWSAPAGPPHVVLFSIWGSGPNDVWAFGYDEMGIGALRWNGQTWARSELLGAAALGAGEGFSTKPVAAWGSGSDDIWVAAIGPTEPPGGIPPVNSPPPASLFLHWNGHAWSRDSSLDAQVVASMQVAAMWGNGPNDVWAVGSVESEGVSGAAVHWDGTRWSAVTTLSSTDLANRFVSVWSSSSNDVWIGTEGGVLHWDGQSWAQPISGGSGYAVGGSGPTDVWAITAYRDPPLPPNASHWDGTSWHQFSAPDVNGAISVVSSSATNAWLLHDANVDHWDGTAWTPSDTGNYQFALNLYWDGTQVWTIAMDGIIRHP
jgi:hypothetical protein